jgi:hypothetical protein
MRRTVLVLLATLVVVLGLGAATIATGGGADSSTVTRARLERSLPVVFSHLYVQQTHLLGRHDVTPKSLHAQAMCDKGGADGADVGPGGDWNCLMSWDDPEVPMPAEGYGKFELNVHSNDCYTAGGPSKLTGFQTITDVQGDDVTNPVFEFDGCFDPDGDNTPTDVLFPSLLNVTSTALTPDRDGRVGLQVTCGTGSEGCAGTVTATSGTTDLGRLPFDIREENSATLTPPGAVPAGADEVTFHVDMATGVGPTGDATVPVGNG